MRVFIHFVLLLAAAASSSAQVVDRMVAVVNKRVILQSQLEQSVRVECFMSGKPLAQVTETDLQEALDRMVDQALLDQQIVNPVQLDPTPEELAERVKDVRSQLPEAATNQQWKALLAAYGISEQDLSDRLTEELRLLKFVDLRFRGTVRVGRNAISRYYEEKFIPELRKQGAPEPPLAEVSPKIEKLLTEQRIDDMLNEFLQSLRAQARIQKMLPIENNLGQGVSQ